MTEFHMDALRLDAVHGIYDFSAYHILEELADSVHELGELTHRRLYVIPESDLNDSRLIRSREIGGFGLDAQWNDDFHHALHALLTGESNGYYQDFGELSHLVKAFRQGYVYSGERSKYRLRRHGNSSAGIPATRFVVFSQNHDQVGNRACNERLSQLLPLEGLKLAAGLVLLSPFIPLLFMGEEYGEIAPFPYFISHSDQDLAEAVRKGRCEEFAAFRWNGDPPGPQDEKTFWFAKLNHELRPQGAHLVLYAFYRQLIGLRNQLRSSIGMAQERMEVTGFEQTSVLLVRYWKESEEVAVIFNLSRETSTGSIPLPAGMWSTCLDSEDPRWNGRKTAAQEPIDSRGEVTLELPGYSFLVLTRDPDAKEPHTP
jgi:maltooligosyltrehalose trehalohydrolase